MAAKTSRLTPCPFCGELPGKPEQYGDQLGNPRKQFTKWRTSADGTRKERKRITTYDIKHHLYAMQCSNIKCPVRPTAQGNSPRGCIRKWNTRKEVK